MMSSGTNPSSDRVETGDFGSAAWELLLPAAAAPARRRGRALQSALREAVRSGRLVPGTRLPSSRALAVDLRVSRGLVTEAYEQLTAEGYLRSGRGAGTWVSGTVRAATPGARDRAPRAPAARVDFRPGTPDLSLFPRSAWAATYHSVLGRLPHSALGYPDPRGLPELREALAALLTRRRGVVADPERLVVCSGVAQAMTLLGFVLHGRGIRAVGVEDPGSPEHAALFASAGIATTGLPLDGEGLAAEALGRSGVGAVVTTPAHQFPTGIAYSATRRGRLLDWARTTDGLIVEDDYDGDFRYDRAPVGSLQGLDPEHVAYTGSVSKSLAPGLRLGWLLAPASMTDEIVARKRTMDLGNPAVDQAVLADFIGRGGYDRQLRRCQRAYRERRDTMTSALAQHFPGTEVSGIAAGLHIIARLPERYGPEPVFLARADEASVALRPLSDFGTLPFAERTVNLVLGYAHLPPPDIAEGVRLLAAAHGPGSEAPPYSSEPQSIKTPISQNRQ
ncbi:MULTISPECIES: MocR-like pyridoxine biosynthesis transcription factor PdxR [unclassified Streptomyces]|uniref:MocR-like pyridoxine biosynthesis transcription factor PdxR n=1 Tax=unclassified Streptomyces TaxID=2593676 RepID=UPI00224E3250|nr:MULTISPECIES: PLP-dependent aminotransferase family protein [unclassified Streptomyces]WSP53853.1 PLP-dependent aminotransferase family protein [Streptomyces sp. NBC_01241]WSU25476.1 PLP-dependent aminotransferase family protein [Streptomyces sp. NBC_01108]MCX4785261.1 PLP-dependent aminotransferase family protein [Streptomyces sp. NBC_01221]MCX4798795.1 PLP-dependent aminotransferase family protein [Streptomyces sp. NBC_01242]WSP66303.1 PLP-dependent aminotransferase family protein [Strept